MPIIIWKENISLIKINSPINPAVKGTDNPAKTITANGISEAGIDRSNNGQLGVRGGSNNGIEKNNIIKVQI